MGTVRPVPCPDGLLNGDAQGFPKGLPGRLAVAIPSRVRALLVVLRQPISQGSLPFRDRPDQYLPEGEIAARVIDGSAESLTGRVRLRAVRPGLRVADILLRDRHGKGSVVLLAFHTRLAVLRRDQPTDIAKRRDDSPAPIISTASIKSTQRLVSHRSTGNQTPPPTVGCDNVTTADHHQLECYSLRTKVTFKITRYSVILSFSTVTF